MGTSPCSSCHRAPPEIAGAYANGSSRTIGQPRTQGKSWCDCNAPAPEVLSENALPLPAKQTQQEATAGGGVQSTSSLEEFEPEHPAEAYQHLQRVESRDENTFARQKDVAKKLLETLQIESEFTKSASESSSFSRFKSVRGSMWSPQTPGTSSQGLTLNFPITTEEAETYRSHLVRFGSSKPLNADQANDLITHFIDKHLEIRQTAVATVAVPPATLAGTPGKLVVVGDTHGQLQDVLHIFHEYGPPSTQNVYLFNGDIADRGSNSCEIFFLLAMYFLAEPSSVYINRGNHENEDMNAMDQECGGGFFNECADKYGIDMYWQFVDLMKCLPLCTIIGEKVFVVHAGLTRYRNLRIDFINKINHQECTVPDLDSEKMEDLVWLDLVWSDPIDEKGLRESARGVGSMFGPDVTEKFCKDNPPLEFVIRSHQLPEGQRGYMYQKGRRCITIFSASNYCGDSGNQGAVLIFDSEKFPQYSVYEHFAPALDAMAGLMNSSPEVWREAGKSLKQHQTRCQEDMWKEKELNKMMVAIVEAKPDIWGIFLDKTGGAPFIDYKSFVEILSATIGESWNWTAAWKAWQNGKSDSTINFKEFLQRFTVAVANDDVVAFKFQMITHVYESILHSHSSLQETLNLFDKDGDGMVDMSEMREVLRTIDVGLTLSQIDCLLHTLFQVPNDAKNVPRVAVKEFLGRFCMVYKSAESALAEGHGHPEHRLALEAMSLIGRHIAGMSFEELGLSKPGLARLKTQKTLKRSSITENTKMQAATTGSVETSASKFSQPLERSAAKKGTANSLARKEGRTNTAMSLATAETGVILAIKFECLFERLDEDGSGVLSHDEFIQGLLRVPGISTLKLANGDRISEAYLRSLSTFIDKDKNGISILELLEAFCFEDTGGAAMPDSLTEHILAVLFRHRQAVRAGARFFDSSGTGMIRCVDFQKVLEALNSATGSQESLLQSQIFRLCEALTDEDAETINYEDFFDSFEVLDTLSDRAVKLGKRQDAA